MLKTDNETTYTAKEFIERYIIRDISDIVESRPYHAFFLLSTAIEVLGKCLNPDSWQTSGKSEEDFSNAINQFESLKDYRCFNCYKTDKNGNQVINKGRPVLTNELFSLLRCGLLHAALPKNGIFLTDQNEDLSRKLIGCREMYQRICNAWNEAKNNPSLIKKNLLEPDVFHVNGSISGTTSTNKTVVQS